MKRAQLILACLVAVMAAGCGAKQENKEGLGAGGNPDMSRDSAPYSDSLGYIGRDSVSTDTTKSDTPGAGKY